MIYTAENLKKTYVSQSRTGEESGLSAILFGLKTKYERDFLKFYDELIKFYSSWIESHKRIPKKYKTDLAAVKSSREEVVAALSILKRMIGSSKNGVSEKEIDELFGIINQIEDRMKYWHDRSREDMKLKKKLGEMEHSHGLKVEDLNKTHKRFREAVQSGGITRQSWSARIKELAPELHGVGEYMGQQALVGLLGPLAIPAQHLMGTASRLMAESKTRKQVSARSTFLNQIGVSDAYTDYNEMLSKTGTPLGKKAAGYNETLQGIAPTVQNSGVAAVAAPSQIMKSPGVSYGSSGGGSKDLFAFFDKDAYKTKYLVDLLNAVKGGKGQAGSSGSGGLLGGLLGAAAGGIGAFLSGALGGLFRGGVWGALIGGISKVMQGIPILSKFGSVLVKFAGPVGLMITAVQGLWGAVNGWKRASDIFGKTPTMMEKFASGFGGAIESLTFGLVKTDWTAPILAKFMNGTAEFFKNLLANMWGGITKYFGGIGKIAKGNIGGGLKDMASGVINANPAVAAFKATQGIGGSSATASTSPVAETHSAVYNQTHVVEAQQQSAHVVATRQLTAQIAQQNSKQATRSTASIPEQRKPISYREDDPTVDMFNKGSVSLSE